MDKPFAQIGADGVDVEKIMQDVKARVAEKKAAGVYDKYNLDGINFLEIKELKDDAQFLSHVINIMNKSWEIDISDFEIVNKGGASGKFQVILKKIIWKLLKFYTYRMFTQQREFNIQAVTALNGLNKRLERLEARVEKLEKPAPRD